MYASIIEFQYKLGMKEKAIEYLLGLQFKLELTDGLNQLITIDRGDDMSTIIVIYDSRTQREAATRQAQEAMAGIAEFLAAPPNRQGFEITINKKF